MSLEQFRAASAQELSQFTTIQSAWARGAAPPPLALPLLTSLHEIVLAETYVGMALYVTKRLYFSFCQQQSGQITAVSSNQQHQQQPAETEVWSLGCEKVILKWYTPACTESR